MSALARLQEKIALAGSPPLLVSSMPNVRWLTGFSGSFGAALASADKGIFITDSRYAIQAAEEVQGFEIRTFGNPRTLKDLIAEAIGDQGWDTVAFEADTVTVQTHLDWTNAFQGVSLEPAKNLLAPLRMIKTPDEVARIERACALADAAFEYMRPRIQPGIAEYDLNLELEFYLRRQGAALAFDPIVVSGPNSARPHGKASERKLEPGDFVTMDFGARIDGFCSDLTRTVLVGPGEQRHRDLYAYVLEAELACLEAMKPGVPAKEVDGLARSIFAKYDMASYFGHGLGHGLGREVHDVGRMGPTSEDVLEPGQVWTVEPGLYVEGFGGVRIEDDVVVTEDGIRILTHSPKELILVP